MSKSTKWIQLAEHHRVDFLWKLDVRSLERAWDDFRLVDRSFELIWCALRMILWLIDAICALYDWFYDWLIEWFYDWSVQFVYFIIRLMR
jgi:hypothetical protein